MMSRKVQTRKRAEGIFRDACEAYPTRQHILRDAFVAHQEGKYTLSVPALLAQVDGVGCDVLRIGRMFYKTTNRSTKLEQMLEGFRLPGREVTFPIGHAHKQMLQVLEEDWSMTCDTDGRKGKQCSPLNRHGVLHGVDTDYDTESNSLRCINHIGYMLEVRWAFNDIQRQVDEFRASLGEA